MLFKLGMLSLAVPAILVAGYFLKYSFKKVGAWLQRSDQPKERAVIIAIMIAIFGFVLGSVMQAQWEVLESCHKNGTKYAVCLFGVK
jgi:H+/Cl- antiporter ClcA